MRAGVVNPVVTAVSAFSLASLTLGRRLVGLK